MAILGGANEFVEKAGEIHEAVENIEKGEAKIDYLDALRSWRHYQSHHTRPPRSGSFFRTEHGRRAFWNCLASGKILVHYQRRDGSWDQFEDDDGQSWCTPSGVAQAAVKTKVDDPYD